MSGKKETYVYGSLRERFALEWKIFALAFVFILIADNIGQIKIPAGMATMTARASTKRVRSKMERTITLPICGRR